MTLVSKRVEAMSGAIALLGFIVVAIDLMISPDHITSLVEGIVVATAELAIVGGGGMWLFNFYNNRKTH